LIPHHGWQSVLLAGGVLPMLLLPLMWLLLPESARFLAARNAPASQIAKVLNKLGGTFSAATKFVIAEPQAQQKAPLRLLFTEQYRFGTLALWATYFMGLLVIYLTMGWMPTLLREGDCRSSALRPLPACSRLAAPSAPLWSAGRWIDAIRMRSLLRLMRWAGLSSCCWARSVSNPACLHSAWSQQVSA
jgi:MFS family permease